MSPLNSSHSAGSPVTPEQGPDPESGESSSSSVLLRAQPELSGHEITP